MKILFLLKHTHSSKHYSNCGDGAGGLLNSTKFVADMLTKERITTKIVVVTDNNDIDREVTVFRPDVVVIEALWVVPSKFDVLKLLHPTVKWIVSIHSNIPFLAVEGIAIEWITGYIDRQVYVAFNALEIAVDIQSLFPRDSYILYLPNYYPPVTFPHTPLPGLHIGCFGAIRPMKNQLLQAIAAIKYADRQNVFMSFHVNASRCEQEGGSVLANLRSLFSVTRHELVEHDWMLHSDFLRLMAMMDISMAVSFSETFCITAADAVVTGTPLVCSDQIPWADSNSIVPTTNTQSMVETIGKLLKNPKKSNKPNLRNLTRYVAKSRQLWLDSLRALSK